MLCVAYHRHRNVTHEDGSYNRVTLLIIESLKCGTDRIGYPPEVNNRINLEAIDLFYSLCISLQLSLGILVTFGINHNGKSTLGYTMPYQHKQAERYDDDSFHFNVF